MIRSVMEDHKKFVCKFCNKRYPCGKSLGGHLRSHRISRADDTEIENGFEASGAYVLRENRRKTWRIADSSGGGERFCKECGKGFQSMKALCGHMACHSEKEKQLIMDSDDSDSGNYSGPRRGKRSRRLRYKNVEFDHSNGSSSVSEIEQEQEEVARCLMMLSRDNFGHGKGLNSFGECSDNNSVVLEAKSSSIKSNEVRVRDNSDSGYAWNCAFKKPIGENKPGFGFLDAEVEKRGSKGCDRVYAGSRSTKEDRELWDLRHEKIENAPKISKFGRYAPDITSRDRGNNNKVNACSDSICESGENSIEADSFSVPNPGSRGITISSSVSSKAKVNKSLISKGKNKVDQAFSGKAKKRLGTKKSKGHECPICFRVFKSGQALGGHKRSHFIGGSDDRTVVVLAKQEVPDISSLLDLNLPAPDEEGNAGFGGR